MLQNSSLEFLKKLKKNNHKIWFDANRAQYESAKSDMIMLCTQALGVLVKLDTRYQDLEAKKCLFRMNRDVRFSKNKDPYKTNLGAAFSIGGKKSTGAGFYIHIEPGNSFVGGGMWQPEADALKKIRQEIDYHWPDFSKIIADKKFKTTFKELNSDEKLVNPPKGYLPDNPAIEFLKLKSFVTGKAFKDEELTSKKFVKEIEQCIIALNPFIEFLNHAVL